MRLAGVLLLLMLVFVIGVEKYGAKKLDLDLAGFELQPSEFVKIIYVFFIAGPLWQSSGQILSSVAVISAIAAVHVLNPGGREGSGCSTDLFCNISYDAVCRQRCRLRYLAAGAWEPGRRHPVVAYQAYSAHVQCACGGVARPLVNT